MVIERKPRADSRIVVGLCPSLVQQPAQTPLSLPQWKRALALRTNEIESWSCVVQKPETTEASTVGLGCCSLAR